MVGCAGTRSETSKKEQGGSPQATQSEEARCDRTGTTKNPSVGSGDPGIPSLVDFDYRVAGNLAVVGMVLDHGSSRMNVCEVVEFEDGKIKRATGYFGEPFEAPEWRARWVERV